MNPRKDFLRVIHTESQTYQLHQYAWGGNYLGPGNQLYFCCTQGDLKRRQMLDLVFPMQVIPEGGQLFLLYNVIEVEEVIKVCDKELSLTLDDFGYVIVSLRLAPNLILHH